MNNAVYLGVGLLGFVCLSRYKFFKSKLSTESATSVSGDEIRTSRLARDPQIETQRSGMATAPFGNQEDFQSVPVIVDELQLGQSIANSPMLPNIGGLIANDPLANSVYRNSAMANEFGSYDAVYNAN